MNKQHIRRLATVGAAAALSLQLLAGVASATPPTATVTTVAIPPSYTVGNVAFLTTFTYGDASTLAKLYGTFTVAGTTSYSTVLTKNDRTVSGACSPSVDNALVTLCSVKTVRLNDVIQVLIVATPTTYASGGQVSVSAALSTTGPASADGGASHGDTSDWIASATSSYNSDDDYDGGYGVNKLTTRGALSSGNPQVAALSNPAATGGVMTIQDDVFCDATFPCVVLNVEDGATYDAPFTVTIKYLSSTAPIGYTHTYTVGTTTYSEPVEICAKRNPTYPCYTWSNKTNTATFYMLRNGTLRRSG